MTEAKEKEKEERNRRTAAKINIESGFNIANVGPSWDDIKNAEETERNRRIERRKEELKKMSRLPNNMAKYSKNGTLHKGPVPVRPASASRATKPAFIAGSTKVNDSLRNSLDDHADK